MHHFRIATYERTSSTVKEIADLAEHGMLPIFKSQPGFQAYSVIQVDDDTAISLSVWETHQEAEDAVKAAADWVAANLADKVSLKTNVIGDALFWSGVAD
jgi:heme-degrading monooxygenase HmoA